jgi:hypothetical protein
MQANIMQEPESDTDKERVLGHRNKKNAKSEITETIVKTKAEYTLDLVLRSGEGEGSPYGLQKLIRPAMQEMMSTLVYVTAVMGLVTKTGLMYEQSYGI